MSLSVNNTGYSNSQPHNSAISSNTTTGDTTTGNNTTTVDKITGKTLNPPTSIIISAEAMARLSASANTPSAPLTSKAEQEKTAAAMLAQRNASLQKNASTADLANGVHVGSEFTAWSTHLKADSGVSKEDFLGLVQQALSSPSSVTTWSYTTDSIEITLKAAKLETLKNRYVDGGYQQQADSDIQSFISSQSDALSNVEKNILQDEYQHSVDIGNADKAEATYQELRRNAEGTSTTQIQRQHIFSLAAVEADNVDAWFGGFRSYISSTTADRYTKSDTISIVDQFQAHWQQFQQQLK